jgi:hypothetical protein
MVWPCINGRCEHCMSANFRSMRGQTPDRLPANPIGLTRSTGNFGLNSLPQMFFGKVHNQGPPPGRNPIQKSYSSHAATAILFELPDRLTSPDCRRSRILNELRVPAVHQTPLIGHQIRQTAAHRVVFSKHSSTHLKQTTPTLPCSPLPQPANGKAPESDCFATAAASVSTGRYRHQST